ncbi:hypothetical protein QZH41_010843, partial [Actinostola sp. cb2023]
VAIVENIPFRRRRADEDEQLDEETHLIQVAIEEKLQDFTKFDPNDTIFREYDPPPDEEQDPKAWKKSLPKLTTSIWECFKYVFLIQTVSGTALGLLAIFLAFLDFNSADLCYDQTENWNQMPHVLLPWYNKQDENTKVVVAAFCPLLTAFPKVVSRLAAQKLKDIHPGTAHVFVGVLYGSTAIVFRIMQAELTSFGLFAALGICHEMSEKALVKVPLAKKSTLHGR